MKCTICKKEGHRRDNKKYHPVNTKTDVVTKIEKSPKKNVKPNMTSKRNEVQAHGFSWENELKINIYGVTKDELNGIKYTSKFDLPAKCNRLDNCDLSIKTSCRKNAVCMADCLRLFDAVNSGNPLHLTVIFYIQNDETKTKKVSSIIEIDLTSSRELLFGTLTRAQIEDLDKAVKSVPQKRKPTEQEYAKMYAIRNSLQKLSGAIHLDIKCDSQQSRLQCSFNRFEDFVKKNPTRVVTQSNTNEFRGGTISAEIQSSRRVFKNKQT